MRTVGNPRTAFESILVVLLRKYPLPVSKLSISIMSHSLGDFIQYSCLENPMDRGAWWAAVHGVARSWTRLSDFTFTSHFHALEEEMATHSRILAWRIPGTGEPGGCRLWGRTESTRLKRLSSSSSMSRKQLKIERKAGVYFQSLITYWPLERPEESSP